MRLAWLIARRFRQGTAKQGFLSFISASSTIGIALGCAVLIAALSMMNGFNQVLQNKLLAVVPQIEYSAVEGALDNWELVAEIAERNPQVVATAPGVNATVMVQTQSTFHGIQVRGVSAEHEQKVSSLSDYVSKEDWQRWQQKGGLLLGAGLAEKLDLEVGDSVSLLTPEKSERGFRSPERVRLQVTGLFQFGGQIDYHNAYVSLDTAINELDFARDVSSVRLRVKDVFSAPAVARQVGNELPELVYLDDWTRSHGHLYRDIELVRWVVYLVLILVMAVACFNIVSTLIMTVAKKRSQIAMLKTLGMKDKTLLQSFVLQGVMNGLYGVVIGCVCGILLAQLLPSIMLTLETWFNFDVLSSDIYFVGEVPSEWIWSDVFLVAGVALLMSLLATLYPAWRAVKVEPAKALHQSI
ncbi:MULTISPECIES: lipoprotein-releasing ABC transporter permease subunit [Idiomarina]|jgi:lipoprotein-releasing system permease protein|uniref:lipoprotein-releasing ABC transporter permease subunit n=1 Tax=Idiomarina TaxID=135575 RepID=UPI000C56630B|nr:MULTISPECIES: lipoprotein-releasing ABC transporter permease subunit [Idiomarina]MAB22010.1 lipoprotein-releasing system transmembrane subunit LolC [Idiomarina sp.]MBH94751.1 lipoprotein-releasing system transmembrane subunit LolC [Idiomarina sp.]MBP59212.1 lipoprotein-releasing system transmembrane subunit LolC [Idiomarina sp.]HAS15361.1 lipoprotein-releasing ABC transporter permease subunit [Idiomarina abyssalis]|tara:strand:- start:25702 stop:26937 length:1236 start_codon:yes stop_codon:yes gene_type:complete